MWEYINIHAEKDECEKCKRVCKEYIYIYIYIYDIYIYMYIYIYIKTIQQHPMEMKPINQTKEKYIKATNIQKCV